MLSKTFCMREKCEVQVKGSGTYHLELEIVTYVKCVETGSARSAFRNTRVLLWAE